MKKVHVSLEDKSYDVLIEKGILSCIEKYIDTKREIVIISDDNIPKKYIDLITPKLNNPLTLFVPQGEQSKSMETAYSLLNSLVEYKVTRSVLIIALGGGVIGDLAGFVASVYMRGVDYIQIPTTLLSQIDSSVGGKVGINSKTMKNSIGSFKQPKLVLIDPDTLSTLEDRQVSSGIAEMIKYGVIASKQLFIDILEKDIFTNIEEYIFQCITIKRNIVVEDEFDYGLRQLLNFGHTIGHAIEQDSKYKLLHGEAVSIGMVMMSKDKPYYENLIRVLNKYNLPTSYEYDKERIYNYIVTDKKASKHNLNIIIADELGKGLIKTINTVDIKGKL